MTVQPSIEALGREVEALKLQSERLQAAERAVQRHNEYLTALHETAMGLIDKLDTQELLQTILERAMVLAGTRHGYIYLRTPDDRYLEMQVGVGFFSDQINRRVAMGQGLGGKVWESGAPLVVEDYQHWHERLPDATLDRLHCALGIPLKADQQVHGVIGLGHVDPERRFTVEDVQLLQRFAALALLALEKGKLYKEVHHELAERRKAEARIRESERRYRNFLESSPDPIVVYNMNGVATYVNPAFEQTFGMARQEILGRNIDFVPPEAWPETRAAIKAMLDGQKINLFETQRLTRDGRTLDVQLSSCLYMDEAGRPVGNIVTLRDISDRKRAERALRSYQDRLEGLVQERTTELNAANRQLALEVEERKRAEKTLRRREVDLQAQSEHLEEVNTALRVLLKQRSEDKNELQRIVLKNVQELVLPYLGQIQKMNMKTRQKTLLGILETNLNHIVSPFIDRLSTRFAGLTPTEIRIANLVKEGKTNKEIAELMLISKNTVLFHRHNIRKKLKLTGTSGNLRSHLLTLEE
ncbi:MAG: PAS domain S-box protein [Desulfobacteraceae bacterium]|nr:MAG: PAS domain S-box protein [Desulfobacteraceae bacterium]